ncbi:hypothetical protein XBFFL1_1190005 [Xenorhabdus bovienii str. feltiae Florida]|nr:hypothetical protein XBFFR1_2070096 [Xenorhabdus bovienii str. feltiae France]CDG90911.1 hypothetical protein XBFFL1_1190005 [Xenorhabdus bovienii str. feltiae Florida]
MFVGETITLVPIFIKVFFLYINLTKWYSLKSSQLPYFITGLLSFLYFREFNFQ